ncbi:MAG TPA: TIGR02452 family protein [candidate division Zixibacteria bacterium]|nr:TIGR02452 family protein [candidate division Zixibacteria bacterium]
MEEARTRISREIAAAYGREAVEIIDRGSYRTPSGRVVSIAAEIAFAVEGTKPYPPDALVPDSRRGTYSTTIAVENETTLCSAKRLRDAGANPVALNFASATHPGGGFLSGARAQEEYLARSSALYACLRGNAMYAYHAARRDALYSNYAIYSPAVPVFRSDEGTLLDEPYCVGIITSPAVNANALEPSRSQEILPAMWSRILKVLSIGLLHGHDSIVLGAWGCGAFGNDPLQIALLFQRALQHNFTGAYRHVAFAIVDGTRERKFIGPFERVFRRA